MKLNKFAFIPFALFVAACGGGGSTIDLDGKTPDQQADTVADAECDSVVECGELNFDVGFDQETQMTTCTATFADAEYQACFDERRPDILEVFANCELTADDLATIEDCYNETAALPCVTQAQADDYCQQIIDGVEMPVLEGHEVPQACEDLSAIIEGCTPA